MKTLEPSPMANGDISDASAGENGVAAFKTLNTESPHDSAFLLLIIYPEYESRKTGRYLYTHVHNTITHNEQNVMDERTHTHTKFSFKKEIEKPDGSGTCL